MSSSPLMPLQHRESRELVSHFFFHARRFFRFSQLQLTDVVEVPRLRINFAVLSIRQTNVRRSQRSNVVIFFHKFINHSIFCYIANYDKREQ